MATLKLGPFFGINNRLPPDQLHVATRYDTGDFLRDAVNVDVDGAGCLTHRLEPELLVPLVGAHSLFMTSASGGYLVIAGTLHAITLPEYTEQAVAQLANDEPLSWARVGRDLYYSNGVDLCRVAGTACYPAALPTPATPEVSLAVGTMSVGRYQLAVSYVNGETGEEGGVSPANVVELTTPGGVRVVSPPPAPGATAFNLYLTPAHGEAALLLGTFPLGPAVTAMSLGTGRAARRAPAAPLPPGRLFVSSGRLCSYAGDTLYLGLPYRPGYHDPLAGWISFPAPVSVAVDAQDGLYVAADKTYWLPHDGGALVDVLPHGAVPHTEFALPDAPTVGWFSPQGFVLAHPGGKVETPMAENVELTPPERGMGMVIDREYPRVVACGWCMRLVGDRKPATRYADWPFTSWSGGYGTTPEGICALTRGPSPWRVDLGLRDCGDGREKYLPTAYFGVKSEDRLRLKVSAPGRYGGSHVYETTRCLDRLDMQRAEPGRGLRSNWYSLAVSGVEGTDFRLSTLSFVPARTRLRVV